MVLQVSKVRYVGMLPHTCFWKCPLMGLGVMYNARWGGNGVASFPVNGESDDMERQLYRL